MTQQREKGRTDLDLVSLLTKGISSVERGKLSGSTTACMASIDPQSGVLRVLNLGDSGCLVFRPKPNKKKQKQKQQLVRYELKMATQPLVVGYNAPFQVGNLQLDCVNR